MNYILEVRVISLRLLHHISAFHKIQRPKTSDLAYPFWNGLRETTFEKCNFLSGLRETTLKNEIYQKHELCNINL